MAFHAVLKITDTFLQVLATNVDRRVLVTAIAGVVGVVISLMTGDASAVVMPVQQEILSVLERGGLPSLWGVTLPAVAIDLAMQSVGGCLVTALAAAQFGLG